MVHKTPPMRLTKRTDAHHPLPPSQQQFSPLGQSDCPRTACEMSGPLGRVIPIPAGDCLNTIARLSFGSDNPANKPARVVRAARCRLFHNATPNTSYSPRTQTFAAACRNVHYADKTPFRCGCANGSIEIFGQVAPGDFAFLIGISLRQSR